jgi:hypothetical protein
MYRPKHSFHTSRTRAEDNFAQIKYDTDAINYRQKMLASERDQSREPVVETAALINCDKLIPKTNNR